MPIKGGVGSFLLRKAANKSVRQQHHTGPQYNKRKFFPAFQKRKNKNNNSSKNQKHYHQLHKRVAPGLQVASPTYQPEYLHVSHHGGDVQQRLPSEDFTFGFSSAAPWSAEALGLDENKNKNKNNMKSKDRETVFYKKRVDGVQYSWRPRGRLQLYKVEKRETFVCYRCGYPVRSAMVAVCDGNWDFRMCYSCYSAVARQGMENHT